MTTRSLLILLFLAILPTGTSFAAKLDAVQLSTGAKKVHDAARDPASGDIFTVEGISGGTNSRLRRLNVATDQSTDLGDLRTILGVGKAVFAYDIDVIDNPDGTGTIILISGTTPAVTHQGVIQSRAMVAAAISLTGKAIWSTWIQGFHSSAENTTGAVGKAIDLAPDGSLMLAGQMCGPAIGYLHQHYDAAGRPIHVDGTPLSNPTTLSQNPLLKRLTNEELRRQYFPRPDNRFKAADAVDLTRAKAPGDGVSLTHPGSGSYKLVLLLRDSDNSIDNLELEVRKNSTATPEVLSPAGGQTIITGGQSEKLVISSQSYSFVNDGKSGTVTSTGSTATVTANAHGFSTGNQIVITGATTASLNGTKEITRIDDNSFSFPHSTEVTSAENIRAGATDQIYPQVSVRSILGNSTGDNLLLFWKKDIGSIDLNAAVAGTTTMPGLFTSDADPRPTSANTPPSASGLYLEVTDSNGSIADFSFEIDPTSGSAINLERTGGLIQRVTTRYSQLDEVLVERLQTGSTGDTMALSWLIDAGTQSLTGVSGSPGNARNLVRPDTSRHLRIEIFDNPTDLNGDSNVDDNDRIDSIAVAVKGITADDQIYDKTVTLNATQLRELSRLNDPDRAQDFTFTGTPHKADTKYFVLDEPLKELISVVVTSLGSKVGSGDELRLHWMDSLNVAQNKYGLHYQSGLDTVKSHYSGLNPNELDKGVILPGPFAHANFQKGPVDGLLFGTAKWTMIRLSRDGTLAPERVDVTITPAPPSGGQSTRIETPVINLKQHAWWNGDTRYRDCVVTDMDVSETGLVYLAGITPVSPSYSSDIGAPDDIHPSLFNTSSLYYTKKDGRINGFGASVDPNSIALRQNAFDLKKFVINTTTFNAGAPAYIIDLPDGENVTMGIAFAFSEDLQELKGGYTQGNFHDLQGTITRIRASRNQVYIAEEFKGHHLYEGHSNGWRFKLSKLNFDLTLSQDNYDQSIVVATDMRSSLPDSLEVDARGNVYAAGVSGAGKMVFTARTGTVPDNQSTVYPKHYWWKMNGDLSTQWFYATEGSKPLAGATQADRDTNAANEFAAIVPNSNGSDVKLIGQVHREDITIDTGANVFRLSAALNEQPGSAVLQDVAFLSGVDAEGKLKRILEIIVRANFGNNGRDPDQGVAINSNAIEVIDTETGQQPASLIISSDPGNSQIFDIRAEVKSGRRVKVSVPEFYFVDDQNNFINPASFPDTNTTPPTTFEDAIRDSALRRYASSGYTQVEELVRGTTNSYTFTVEDDTTVQFHWDLFYSLVVDSDFSDLNGDGVVDSGDPEIQSKATGNPVPDVKKHWIEKNALVSPEIDGVSPAPDPVDFLTRYTPVGYSGKGAANPETPYNDLTTGKFTKWLPGELRQKVTPFVMEGPASILYHWIRQNAVRASTTTSKAHDLVRVRVLADRVASIAGQSVTLHAAEPADGGQVGSGLFWFATETRVEVSSFEDSGLGLVPSGFIFSTGDLADVDDTTLTVLPFTLNNGASISFNFGQRIHHGVVPIGSFLNFSGQSGQVFSPEVTNGRLTVQRDKLFELGRANLVNRDFAIDFWIKRTRTDQEEYVVSHVDANVSNLASPDARKSLHVGFLADRSFVFDIQGHPFRVPVAEYQAHLNNSETDWNHWAVSFDNNPSGNETRKVFLNGKEIKSDTLTSSIGYEGDPGVPFYVAFSPQRNVHFRGEIDSIRVWKTADSSIVINGIRDGSDQLVVAPEDATTGLNIGDTPKRILLFRNFDEGSSFFGTNTITNTRDFAPGVAPHQVTVIDGPSGTTPQNAVLWDDVNKRLYPLRPSTLLVEWKKNSFIVSGRQVPDPDDLVFTQVRVHYPIEPHYRNVVGTPPISVDPRDDDQFAFKQIAYSESNAQFEQEGNLLNTPEPGRTVLTFFEHPAGENGVATGNDQVENLRIRVLESSVLNTDSDLKFGLRPTVLLQEDETTAVIGRTLRAPRHPENSAAGDLLDLSGVNVNGVVANVVNPSTPSRLELRITDLDHSITAFEITLTGKAPDDSDLTEKLEFSAGLRARSVNRFKSLVSITLARLAGNNSGDVLNVDWQNGERSAALGVDGYVFRDRALYNVNIHSRAVHSGPIVPVNQEFTNDPVDDLLVVWYESSDNIAFPFRPVRYKPRWPLSSDPDAKRIVIASQLGSEGVNADNEEQLTFDLDRFDNLAVYAQNDRNVAGYNPNEEHALIAASLLNAGVPGAGPAAFALRNDQNIFDGLSRNTVKDAEEHPDFTGHPFVLVQYRDLQAPTPEWRMSAYEVVTEDAAAKHVDRENIPLEVVGGKVRNRDDSSGHGFADTMPVMVNDTVYFVTNATGTDFELADSLANAANGVAAATGLNGDINAHLLHPYTFNYRMKAGELVIPPYPLSEVIGLSICPETRTLNGDASRRSAFRDHRGTWWAVSGESHLFGRFYYPLLGTFDNTDRILGGPGLPIRLSSYPPGSNVPWLLERPPAPIDDPAPDNRYTDGTAEFGNNPKPFAVRYEVLWPDSLQLPPDERLSVAELKVGETLTFAGGEAKGDRELLGEAGVAGLPGVIGFSAGQIVFDDSNPAMDPDRVFDDYLARLINPLTARAVDATLPTSFEPANVDKVYVDGTRVFFKELHAGLQTRVYFDLLAKKLVLRGFINENTLGDTDLLAAPPSIWLTQPNVLSDRDKATLRTVLSPFGTIVDALIAKADNPEEFTGGKSFTVGLEYAINPLSGKPDSDKGQPKQQLGPGLALIPNPRLPGTIDTTTEFAIQQGGGTQPSPVGYLTLAENNHSDLGAAPITMHIIKVVPKKFRGAVQPVFPPNVFDEKITARFTGDFGGNPDELQFQWIYREEDGSDRDPPAATATASDIVNAGWTIFSDPSNSDGIGMVEAVFEGTGKIILQDNLAFVRWRHRKYATQSPTDPGAGWSTWAGAANNNPIAQPTPQWRAQLVEGWIKRVMRAINPFDARFSDFRNNDAPATYASIIQQAGQRYEGPVALNPSKENVENLGLIELYETILERALDLSINIGPSQSGPGVNNAILLAASRISDLYHMLGNEAYSDALNPTIGFDTASQEYGHLAPTIFSFQNQLPSLLDEELALLRGIPEFGARPTYNRLLWNFTIGDGEVAYAMNYGIDDKNNDGFIDEADARATFPMGHGDAWGHYTTALTTWYKLLQHPNYLWESRAELFQIEGQTVAVDYLDERKFANAASDRARAGAEIVEQTYRLNYVSDPEAQFQGYKDTDADRQWGVTGWARRSGQAALLDWATANALLPAEAPNPGRTIAIDSVVTTDGGQSYQINLSGGETLEADADSSTSDIDSYRLRISEPVGTGEFIENVYSLTVSKSNAVVGSASFVPETYAVSQGSTLAINATAIPDGGTSFAFQFTGNPVPGLTAADIGLFLNGTEGVPILSVVTGDSGQSYTVTLDGKSFSKQTEIVEDRDYGEGIFQPGVLSDSSDLVIDHQSITAGASSFTIRFPDGQPVGNLDGSAFHLAADRRPTGIRKVDRNTVVALVQLASEAQSVQRTLDSANSGFNPLGVSPDVVPFDIDASLLDREGFQDSRTHFEQVLERAETALSNAVRTFDYANSLDNLIRNTSDSVEEFFYNAIDQDRDLRGRMIEIYGMPYEGTIGSGRVYPEGYQGPDLLLHMYMNVASVSKRTIPPLEPSFAAEYKGLIEWWRTRANDGTFLNPNEEDSGFDGNKSTPLTNFFSGDVVFQPDLHDFDAPSRYQSLDKVIPPEFFPQSPGDFTFQRPVEWGNRLATGRLQDLLMEMIQADAELYTAVDNYTGHAGLMIDQFNLLKAFYDELALPKIDEMEDFRTLSIGLGTASTFADAVGSFTNYIADLFENAEEDFADGIPEVFVAGLSNGGSVGSVAKGAVRAVGTSGWATSKFLSMGSEIASGALDLALEIEALNTELRLERMDLKFDLRERLEEIDQSLRDENVLRVRVLGAQERLRQVGGQYTAALQEGIRLLDERRNLNARMAAQTTKNRYRDVTFRLSRNDALQKYRAAFNHAAKMAFIAAKTYDYETNLDPRDPASSQAVLEEIIRARGIGLMVDGHATIGGGGLAEAIARLKANYAILKPRLGLNNPQKETGRFSVRKELFRIKDGNEGDEVWRQTLNRHKVNDLWDVPEFRRYCRPPQAEASGELPGIVIPFQSYILYGKNFFGWKLGPGDNAYDPSNFATKIRSAGVWFQNYNNTGLANTPRVYLIPAGDDVMTVPTSNDLSTRIWNVVDERIPVPLPIGSLELNDPNWIPMKDSVQGQLGEIRQFSSFRAYHDSGNFSNDEVHYDIRLAGRSVWNTRWLLVIPGGHLLGNPEEGLRVFVDGQLVPGNYIKRDGNGVKDIKLFFETYAHSGN